MNGGSEELLEQWRAGEVVKVSDSVAALAQALHDTDPRHWGCEVADPMHMNWWRVWAEAVLADGTVRAQIAEEIAVAIESYPMGVTRKDCARIAREAGEQ